MQQTSLQSPFDCVEHRVILSRAATIFVDQRNLQQKDYSYPPANSFQKQSSYCIKNTCGKNPFKFPKHFTKQFQEETATHWPHLTDSSPESRPLSALLALLPLTSKKRKGTKHPNHVIPHPLLARAIWISGVAQSVGKYHVRAKNFKYNTLSK